MNNASDAKNCRRRTAGVRVVVLWSTLALACACGTTAGGGVGISFTGGNAGTACQAASQDMGCISVAGAAAPTYQVVRCDAASGAWVLVTECPAGHSCQESSIQGNATAKKAQCIDYSGGGVDAGGQDGSVDGGPQTGTDATSPPTDGGMVTQDTAAGDVSDPCSKCFPGQTCVDGVCKNPDPCAKCTEAQTCIDGVCVDPVKPCPNGCPSGTFCDPKANNGKGACVGGKCQVPKSWTGNVQKLTSLAIADTNNGCDVDGDGDKENAFGGLKGLIPADSLQGSIKDGSLVILLEAPAWNTNGGTFIIGALGGELAGGNCNPLGAGCSCLVTAESYDDEFAGSTCPPLTLFDATVIGGQLKAKATTPVVIPLPLMGTTLALNLHKATIEGNVTGPGSWIQTTNGVLCGAIKQTELMDAIDAVPESQFKDLGISKDMAKSVLQGVLKPDIDVDGDGSLESVSMALQTSTHKAAIVGVVP